jgi:hypothetical protein
MKELVGLIGVVLGFLLSQFATTWWELWKGKQAIKHIAEELQANLEVLPQRRDIVKKIKAALDQNEILPGQGVPFLTKAYEYNLHIAYPYLSPIQRDSLHVIYERLKHADIFLFAFESELIKHLDLKLMNNPFNVYSLRMDEILKSFSVIEGLGKNILKTNQ